jgi:hypothetical protein
MFVNCDVKSLFHLLLILLDKEEVTCPATIVVKGEASEFGKVTSAFSDKNLNHSFEPCMKMTMQLRNNHSSTQFVRIYQ